MNQNKIRDVIELEDPYKLFETLDEKDFYLLPADKKEKDAFLQSKKEKKPKQENNHSFSITEKQ